MAEDLPAQSYEEVEAPNTLPIPPKPQPKRAQSKPKATAEKVDSTPEAISMSTLRMRLAIDIRDYVTGIGNDDVFCLHSHARR